MTSNRYPDGKYVIFKKEEFIDWAREQIFQGKDNVPMPAAVEDAVVIRRKDVFAAPALDAYANSIKIARDLILAEGGELRDVSHLNELIDFFQSEADLAWHANNRKVPD